MHSYTFIKDPVGSGRWTVKPVRTLGGGDADSYVLDQQVEVNTHQDLGRHLG